MATDGPQQSVASDAASVRLVLEQIEAGQLEASATVRHFLAGALAALEDVAARPKD